MAAVRSALVSRLRKLLLLCWSTCLKWFERESMDSEMREKSVEANKRHGFNTCAACETERKESCLTTNGTTLPHLAPTALVCKERGYCDPLMTARQAEAHERRIKLDAAKVVVANAIKVTAASGINSELEAKLFDMAISAVKGAR